MITQIEGVRIDQEQFPETYRIKNRIRKIAGQFKCSIEDLLQESMLLEFQIEGIDRIISKAGYIIISLIHKQSGIRRKTDRTIPIANIPDHDKDTAFAVYIRKDIIPGLIVQDALDAIGRKDKELHDMLTRRIQHEDKTWRWVQKMYFGSKSNAQFYNQVNKIKDTVKKVNDQYAGVAHDRVL